MNVSNGIKYTLLLGNDGEGSAYEQQIPIAWEEGEGSFRKAVVRIAPTVEKGSVITASALLRIKDTASARVFMNGYQTWTYCPEYSSRSRIRGMHGIPNAIKHAFSLDRYGDYHFVDYPFKRGVVHGVSYCYFREGSKFLLIGSLDETNGYTLFEYSYKGQLLTIRRDCEELEVEGRFEVFSLFIAEGSEDEVFDAWFDAMGIKPITTEPISGYSSWYNRYQDISDSTITEDLTGCAKVMREDQLDAEGAVVSCGPAYIALMVDAMTRSGVEKGLPAADCREMVLTTMRGVCQQMLDSGEHPRSYMERVTSPGGTTAAGLRELEPNLVFGVEEAVDAALARTEELSRAK